MKKIGLAIIALVAVALILLSFNFTGHLTVEWATPERMLHSAAMLAVVSFGYYCVYMEGKKKD